MADETRPAIGLSIGATNLAAATADRAVTRRSVLTLYRQRPPEVGVPSENPRLDEPGLVITDFVDRVGDPVGIVAADGSTHRSEALVADGLRALAYTATGGRALPETAAVTYPAHWGSAAVDAVRGALSQVPEWSGGRFSLLPDATAALIALRADPGVPARGTIAVCDFGGSGTSITLVDAADDYRPTGSTVRHTDFSGNLIDQALLDHVLADLSASGSFDASATSAIGSVTRLRAECRTAKEQLSSSTATTLNADLPGFRGDIRLTRTELDDVIRRPLDALLAVVQELLGRSGIRTPDLAAVASVGGGASIPLITTTLSERLQVPVITAPRPQLTSAIGAALRAAHGPGDDSPTALAATAAGFAPPTEAVPTSADLGSSGQPALAWSEADDDSGIMPLRTGEYPRPAEDAGAPAVRPPQQVDRGLRAAEARRGGVAWYRRPAVLVVGTALVVLALAAVIMIILRHTSGGPLAPPAPGVSTTPAPESSVPTTESGAPQSTTGSPTSPPQSSSASTTPSPSSSTQTTTTQTPSSSAQTTTTQATTTQATTTQATTTQATTTQVPTSSQPPVVPPVPRIPAIPGFIPQPGKPGS
jgi:actin-like ATPase involved in cell morphogenesis